MFIFVSFINNFAKKSLFFFDKNIFSLCNFSFLIFSKLNIWLLIFLLFEIFLLEILFFKYFSILSIEDDALKEEDEFFLFD